ncbi:MAG: substrate-binding domain-containing protein [Planctomycetota bacterium]
MRRAPWLLACLAVCAGCAPLARRARRPRFVFVTCAVDAPFFKPVKKGMRDAARRMDVDCEFIGTEGVDPEAQAAMVRRAVADGCDGLAVNLIDPKAFDEVVQEARDKGIPVVAFNVDDHATPNARMSAVCQNLYQAGRSMGKAALEFIPSNSQVLMTMHDEGVSALEDRLRGAQEVLKTQGVTWTVVITGNDSQKGAEVIAQALKANPKIRYVLGTGQSDTEAAGLTIEKHFAGQGYASAGFDLSPETLRLVQAGIIRFTIDQQPYVQGFYPVVQLALHCRYGLMPSDIDAGAAFITRENVESVMALSEKEYR